MGRAWRPAHRGRHRHMRDAREVPWSRRSEERGRIAWPSEGPAQSPTRPHGAEPLGAQTPARAPGTAALRRPPWVHLGPSGSSSVTISGRGLRARSSEGRLAEAVSAVTVPWGLLPGRGPEAAPARRSGTRGCPPPHPGVLVPAWPEEGPPWSGASGALGRARDVWATLGLSGQLSQPLRPQGLLWPADRVGDRWPRRRRAAPSEPSVLGGAVSQRL